MTPRMRLGFAIAPVLVVSAAVFLIAADIASPHPADVTVQAADLTVHEWGTFTSVAGEDGSAIEWDALGCKDDLPGFVNDFGYRGFKWRLRGTVRMETPVMYFYSPREIEAHVKVAFLQGLITEWYPQATHEVYQMMRGGHGSPRRLETNLNGIDTSLRSVTGAIEWNHIRVQPNTALALPIENGPSRYYAARDTDAAPIAVGDQHEKFLFYRGVGRFPIPLSARLSEDGTILVENHGHDAVPSVMLFENREGRVGYRNAGAIEDTMTLEPPPLDDSVPQLRYDLENALVEQGLFLKEAQAMVETWRDAWFEEGVRLIYIIPSRAVDAILPLRVDPAPSQIVRVFVGRIELVTPDTTRAVEEALVRSDWSTIDRHRRFLEPILRRIERGGLESANQAERLLRRLNESIGARACR
jgi:hypothetical protein